MLETSLIKKQENVFPNECKHAVKNSWFIVKLEGILKHYITGICPGFALSNYLNWPEQGCVQKKGVKSKLDKIAHSLEDRIENKMYWKSEKPLWTPKNEIQ